MKNITLLGCGYAAAEHCVTNVDLENVVDTNDEWINQRTGIRSRYVSSQENTSDLGYRAAMDAIKKAKIDVKAIDLIVVATTTPDHFTPSSACLIQERLGLNDCHVMAFDINAACSGFLYAMHVASSMLGQYHCALVIGSETLSKIIDWKDRNTCVLFGDGAGAAILCSTPSDKQVEFFAQSIGDHKGILRAEGIPLHGALKNVDKTFGYLQMDGGEVYRFAVKAMEDAMNKVLSQANKTMEDVDLIIPHQANIRIIRHVAKRMNIKEDKFFINLEKFGNTSAASVATALAQAFEEMKIQQGSKVLLVGFGAGFTYAACYLEL